MHQSDFSDVNKMCSTHTACWCSFVKVKSYHYKHKAHLHSSENTKKNNEIIMSEMVQASSISEKRLATNAPQQTLKHSGQCVISILPVVCSKQEYP